MLSSRVPAAVATVQSRRRVDAQVKYRTAADECLICYQHTYTSNPNGEVNLSNTRNDRSPNGYSRRFYINQITIAGAHNRKIKNHNQTEARHEMCALYGTAAHPDC